MSSSSVDPTNVNSENNHGDDEETRKKAEKLKEDANKFFKGMSHYFISRIDFIKNQVV